MNKILKKPEYGKKGFTLVEVIVVIVIIAILAAIAVPALTGYIERAKDRAAAVEGRNVLNALTSATTFVYGFGTFDSGGGQDGMLNWNGGDVKGWHNYNGDTSPYAPTAGYSMVAKPNGYGILTDRALEEVSVFLDKDQNTVKTSLYALIVEFNNKGTRKNDNIAAFVYKLEDDLFIAYKNKDANFQSFSTAAEALAFAKSVSVHF